MQPNRLVMSASINERMTDLAGGLMKLGKRGLSLRILRAGTTRVKTVAAYSLYSIDLARLMCRILRE